MPPMRDCAVRALICSRKRCRMRTISESRPTICARLEPTSVCTRTATTSSRRSSSGTRLSMSSSARGSGNPMRFCSSTVRNSLPSGSANSLTRTCRARCSECPASSDDLIRSSANGSGAPLFFPLDIKERQAAGYQRTAQREPHVAEKDVAAEQSRAEHQHDYQQDVGDPHVHAGLPHRLFELARQVEVVQTRQQRALFGPRLAHDVDLNLVGGTRQAPRHLALLLDLVAAAAGKEQHANEDEREYAACHQKVHRPLYNRVAEELAFQLVPRCLQPLRVS